MWKYTGGKHLISPDQEFTLSMKPDEYTQMMLMTTVYDYDTLVSSDFLGFIEINLDDIFQHPGISYPINEKAPGSIKSIH